MSGKRKSHDFDEALRAKCVLADLEAARGEDVFRPEFLEQMRSERLRKRPPPLLEPRDRDSLLAAGNRLLLEGLGVDNALQFLRLIGGGRERFDEIRREWADLTVDEALEELRRSGLA